MTQSEASDAKGLHRETGAAWEIVARAGYMAAVAEDVALIRAGGNSLMAQERRLLGDLHVGCRRAIHLQCSGGLDALSLWSLGAREVVGIDISETLIGYARAKSAALGAPATWYCCDVLDAPHELDGTADLVYTGRGALPWILDLEAWAAVVGRLLAPGGRVLVFEGHPLDALWDRDADTFRLAADGASYFEEAPRENPGFPASVVARETAEDPCRPKMRERPWRPGQVLNALAAQGLQYLHFDEYPDLFWNQFEAMPGETARRLPHTYAVLMRKPLR